MKIRYDTQKRDWEFCELAVCDTFLFAGSVWLKIKDVCSLNGELIANAVSIDSGDGLLLMGGTPVEKVEVEVKVTQGGS